MAKEGYDVFISYSREDKHFAQSLSHYLQTKNISTWTDTELKPGMNWQEEILEALEKSKIFVTIISENSIKSQWILFELGLAVGKNKETIIIQKSDIDKATIPVEVANRQIIDGTNISIKDISDKISYFVKA